MVFTFLFKYFDPRRSSTNEKCRYPWAIEGAKSITEQLVWKSKMSVCGSFHYLVPHPQQFLKLIKGDFQICALSCRALKINSFVTSCGNWWSSLRYFEFELRIASVLHYTGHVLSDHFWEPQQGIHLKLEILDLNVIKNVYVSHVNFSVPVATKSWTGIFDGGGINQVWFKLCSNKSRALCGNFAGIIPVKIHIKIMAWIQHSVSVGSRISNWGALSSPVLW